MSDSSPFREFPSYIERSPQRSRKIWIFAGVGIFIVLVLGGLYLLGSNVKKQQALDNTSPVAKNMPTTTPVPTLLPTSEPSVAALSPTGGGKKSPTPTKTPEIDRSELKIAVLNGSGVAGAAKGTSSYLNGLGYTIKRVGNADNYTYKNITIRVNKGKSEFLPILKADLEKNSETGSVSASLADVASADAEVIVGK